MRRRRGGFTIVELLTVMIVIGILAGIALLKYIDLRHRARTAAVVADLQAVRLAAYGAYYETNTWPAQAAPGVVPAGLVQYLPANFSFGKPEYTLEWVNLAPPGGGPSATMQVYVNVTSADPRLQRAIEQSLGNKTPFISVGGTLTFIIVGPDGRA
jgi:prepilin-type N-terminal cleavage/methylation domain-containing protein